MDTQTARNGDGKPPRHPGRRRGRWMRLALVLSGALLLVVAALGIGLNWGPFSGASTSCGQLPSSCGYPDGTNTGLPHGTHLKTVPGQVSSGTGWHYDSRGWVEVDGNGAVLSGLYIPMNLDISANNVTIKDVKVVTGGQSTFGVSLRHTSNVTIEDSTIAGLNGGSGRVLAGVKDIYGDSTGTSVLRDDISLFESGVQLETGMVQGNWIHNSGYIAGDHTNGITSNGGTQQLTINHNTVLIHRGQTDAIGLFEDFGDQANRAITNNLLAGGAYAIYGGANTGGQQTSNIVVTGNKISNIYYPKGGAYGPVAYFDPNGPGNSWSGNVWDATGQTVPSP
jgi:hypothetical protein